MRREICSTGHLGYRSQVKEGVDQETVDAVREVGGKYKYGWSTDIEMEYAPKGLTPISCA